MIMHMCVCVCHYTVLSENHMTQDIILQILQHSSWSQLGMMPLTHGLLPHMNAQTNNLVPSKCFGLQLLCSLTIVCQLGMLSNYQPERCQQSPWDHSIISFCQQNPDRMTPECNLEQGEKTLWKNNRSACDEPKKLRYQEVLGA